MRSLPLGGRSWSSPWDRFQAGFLDSTDCAGAFSPIPSLLCAARPAYAASYRRVLSLSCAIVQASGCRAVIARHSSELAPCNFIGNDPDGWHCAHVPAALGTFPRLAIFRGQTPQGSRGCRPPCRHAIGSRYGTECHPRPSERVSMKGVSWSDTPSHTAHRFFCFSSLITYALPRLLRPWDPPRRAPSGYRQSPRRTFHPPLAVPPTRGSDRGAFQRHLPRPRNTHALAHECCIGEKTRYIRWT